MRDTVVHIGPIVLVSGAARAALRHPRSVGDQHAGRDGARYFVPCAGTDAKCLPARCGAGQMDMLMRGYCSCSLALSPVLGSLRGPLEPLALWFHCFVLGLAHALLSACLSTYLLIERVAGCRAHAGGLHVGQSIADA